MSQKQLQALQDDVARLLDLIKSGASEAIIKACVDDISEVATNPHFE